MADASVSIESQSRPTMTEVGLGLVIMALIGFGGAIALIRAGLAPQLLGLILAGWSGVAGLAGFGAAWLLRRGTPRRYGLQAVNGRWLLLGLAAGVIAFAAKGGVVMLVTSAVGTADNPQAIYAAGGAGGAGSLVLATVLLGVVTPLGEELLFRGVVTNGLLRFGGWAGVIAGALIFALAHGLNVIFPVALLLGLVTGELFRRSTSIWPGVAAHIVYNLPTVALMLAARSNASGAIV